MFVFVSSVRFRSGCMFGNEFLYSWCVLYYRLFFFDAFIGFGVVFCVYEDISKIDFRVF